MSQYEGDLYIIAAPSGAGKTSLVNALLKQLAQVKLSISHTTRAPRQGEVDGEHYFFVSQAAFDEMIQQEVFLEYANVFGHHYGTSFHWVREQLQCGEDVILEIDWQGAQRVRQYYPQAVSIFILPPSLQVLQQRLQLRAQDDQVVIEKRMAQASAEIAHFEEYDYLVINDDFDQALDELIQIFQARRLNTGRQRQMHQELIKELLA